MTMWLIRAGKAGEREKLSLENKAAVIGWEELPDLTPCTTREAPSSPFDTDRRGQGRSARRGRISDAPNI
jgi:predicted Mrr-cat superfamily restriction endonuclease